jgi:hypothetical protein
MHSALIPVLALATLLAGCAGSAMDHARTAPPAKILTSQKPAQRVAECTEFAWQSEVLFGIDANAYLRKGEADGFTVYTREGAYFVDVKPQGAGAALAFYAPANGGDTRDRRLAALATCL